MNSTETKQPPNIIAGALICALAPVVCLLPFITRAFHIDDPMYIWTAQHIHTHPLDFYGFDVNWDGFVKPAAQENKNPPLVSYYIAVVAAIGGWSEHALHVGFLLPAAALGLGTFLLARRLCSNPVLATLIAVFTPAVLVSGSSVMSDVPMVALFVWSMVLWFHGIETERYRWLFGAGMLIAAAALTKYFGIVLVPLLGVYTAMRHRKPGWWIAALTVPVGILAFYESLMWLHYGTGGLINAAGYAGTSQTLSERLGATLTVLAFTGGCIASANFYLALLRLRPLAVVAAIAAVLIVCIVWLVPGARSLFRDVDQESLWIAALHVAVLASLGFIVPTLAIREVWRHRNAESTLLFLWVIGTLVFSAYLNWSVTARTLLPVAPAAGILIARRLETLLANGAVVTRWKWYAPLVPSLILSLAVAWADARLASSARAAAQHFGEETMDYPHNVYFQGHWGFQYYMEAEGAKPVAYGQSDFQPGDVVINPLNNSSVWPVDRSLVATRSMVEFSGPAWLTTMSRPLGAGFYTDLWGPVPFVFGPVPTERYATIVLNGAGTPFEDVTYHE